MSFIKRIRAAVAFGRDFFERPPLWCTLFLAAGVLVARRPSAVLNPQFWAEDGRVFFAQAVEHGLGSLFLPSAGYLHLALRIVAWVTTRFDVVLAPALFVAGTITLTLYVVARTQSPRFPLPRSVAYALAVVLLPNAGEVYLNLTNVQWILAGGLLLLLISRDPVTIGQRVHDGAALAVLGLTGPFVIAAAPLFVWRAVRRRTAVSGTLAVLALLGAAIQAMFIHRTGLPSASGGIAWQYALGIPGVRVGGLLATGGWVGPEVGVAWATLLGVVTLAGIAVLAAWRDDSRIERVWLAIACGLILALGLYRCRTDLGALFFGAAGRYFFVPRLLALWLLIAASGGAVAGIALAARAALATALIATASAFADPPAPDLDWPTFAARIRNGRTVTVPVNPDAAWSFTLRGREVAEAVARTDSARGTPVPLNCSTRGFTSREHPRILGFVVGDDDERPRRPVLIRGVGPSLARLGLASPLRWPKLVLLRNGIPYDADLRLNRDATALINAATERCGAFRLEPGSDDVVGTASLGAGSYSIIASGEHEDDAGELLIEVYELPAGGPAA